MNDEPSQEPTDAPSVDPDDGGGPFRTPLYEANHAPRYQRQALIRQIQLATARSLICYIAGGPRAAIDTDDVMPFVDLLHNVPDNKDLDLMLHTPGGDMDAAEKLISMVREKIGTAELRVIVPDFAKSAGTHMVLGADTVVMSDSSELGPIDPQVFMPDSNGQWRMSPAQSLIDAYDALCDTLTQEPTSVAAQIMLQKLDPVLVQECRAVKERARRLAEDHLRKGMFRNGGNFTGAVQELLDTSRWQSHSQMISWADARDPRIGLHVEYLRPQSREWQSYWQLYCLQRLAVEDEQKAVRVRLRLLGLWCSIEIHVRSVPYPQAERKGTHGIMEEVVSRWPKEVEMLAMTE